MAISGGNASSGDNGSSDGTLVGQRRGDRDRAGTLRIAKSNTAKNTLRDALEHCRTLRQATLLIQLLCSDGR